MERREEKPYLLDTTNLTELDRITLKKIHTIPRGDHTRLRVLVDDHVGPNHPSTQGQEEFGREITYQEIDPEE